MKRVKAACLMQTIHFIAKDGLGHTAGSRAVKEEVEGYKAQLQRPHTRYQITDEIVQSDDSIIIKIKKQVNSHDCGEYMA